jgi:fluoroacetyl-CoA thioesterase
MPSIEAIQEPSMSLIGKTAEVRLCVCPPRTAEEPTLSPGEEFPAVVVNSVAANAGLVALMELAAARLMQPQLVAGQSSTSVAMNVMHLAMHRGGELRAVATALGSNGRMYYFRVHVFDESGLIGSAEHTRAVVLPRRLLAAARRRAGRTSLLLDP